MIKILYISILWTENCISTQKTEYFYSILIKYKIYSYSLITSFYSDRGWRRATSVGVGGSNPNRRGTASSFFVGSSFVDLKSA